MTPSRRDMGRLRLAWPAARADRLVLAGLAALLAVGVGLRLLLMVAKTPAFLGYGDSFFYIHSAQHNLFDDLTHPAGYALLLRSVHVLSASLSLAIVLQHLLGIATALLLFATVRRVAPAGWGLLPAAAVLLAGPQLFLEHAVMSEPLFALLLAGLCYCALRVLDDERPLLWATLAGLCGAGAACVRSIGLLFAIVVVIWLVLAANGDLRRRLVVGGAAALTAWLLVAGYVVVAKHEGGYVGPGLTRGGGLSLYAQVAPFADCGRFTPPPGTRGLCERRPASRRPGPIWYVLDARSPGVRRLAGTFKPSDNTQLTAFARAAIVHQPLDYANRVAHDMSRYWSSGIGYRLYEGESYGALVHFLVEGPYLGGAGELGSWYATAAAHERGGLVDTLRGYERRTRLEGPWLVLLVLLALIGVPLAHGRRRAAGYLLLAVSATALIAPVVSAVYAARYAVPGYGSLAAAGAIGAATLWERATVRRTRRDRSLERHEGVAA